jgi:hypothetical protein
MTPSCAYIRPCQPSSIDVPPTYNQTLLELFRFYFIQLRLKLSKRLLHFFIPNSRCANQQQKLNKFNTFGPDNFNTFQSMHGSQRIHLRELSGRG